MFNPRVFREDDATRLFGLIEEYGFGMLVAQAEDGALEIAHQPFLVERGAGALGTLRCHVARSNPIWRLAQDRVVTAVFSGPHGYVSARWYEQPGEQVPTWNYAVVHARGRAAAMPKDELRRLLEDLAAANERGAEEPWTVGAMVPGLADELLDGIVGIAITVEHLEGKFKLSQNRSAEDRARVRGALAARGRPDDLAMLRWMREQDTD